MATISVHTDTKRKVESKATKFATTGTCAAFYSLKIETFKDDVTIFFDDANQMKDVVEKWVNDINTILEKEANEK